MTDWLISLVDWLSRRERGGVRERERERERERKREKERESTINPYILSTAKIY